MYVFIAEYLLSHSIRSISVWLGDLFLLYRVFELIGYEVFQGLMKIFVSRKVAKSQRKNAKELFFVGYNLG